MFARIVESLHSWVMLIGLKEVAFFSRVIKFCLGGLLGSTFSLLVEIGFGSGHILPLIWTQIDGRKSSPCSAEGSNGENQSWTCIRGRVRSDGQFIL